MTGDDTSFWLSFVLFVSVVAVLQYTIWLKKP